MPCEKCVHSLIKKKISISIIKYLGLKPEKEYIYHTLKAAIFTFSSLV